MPMFDVTYSITRSETYRIKAANRAEAEATAFEEGEEQASGDTTDVTHLETKKVKL